MILNVEALDALHCGVLRTPRAGGKPHPAPPIAGVTARFQEDEQARWEDGAKVELQLSVLPNWALSPSLFLSLSPPLSLCIYVYTHTSTYTDTYSVCFFGCLKRRLTSVQVPFNGVEALIE